jgi:prepilin-type processing-associated H-X9-DG protein
MDWRRHLDRRVSSRDCGGFTRTELMAVMASVAVLALLILPLIAGSDTNRTVAVCLNNHRRLVQSWLLYADDSEGRVANNMGLDFVQSSIQSGRFDNWANNVMTWAVGSSVIDSSNTNSEWAAKGPMVPYGRVAIDIYRCPADGYLSPAQRQRGWSHRLRSVSMNAFFGRHTSGFGNDPTRQEMNYFFPNYRQFIKLSSVPDPVNRWVFIEEHPDSINDGYFLNTPETVTSWGDVPSSLHDGAVTLSFADGHSDVHRWTSTRTILPVRYMFVQGSLDQAGRGDYRWLMDRMALPR